VTWNDLTKPLHSALGARLYLIYQSRNDANSIPRDIPGQGIFWERHYRPAGDVNYFVNRANSLEQGCTSNYGSDIIFVLDSSGSVGQSNFEKMKKFVSDVVRSFDIGTGQAQTMVGVIKYSTSVYTEFNLKNHTTKDALLTAISKIIYKDGYTYTNKGLDEMVFKGFTSVAGARPLSEGHPRVAIVVTDGKSTDPPKTVMSALRAHDADITVFAVGVGSTVDMNELAVIASEPVCQHLMLLSNFTEFESLTAAIEKKTCEAPIIISPEQNQTHTELPGGGDQNCKIMIPRQGVTIKVKTSVGLSTFYVGLSSYPSSVYFDAMTESSPGKLGVIFIPQPTTLDAEATVFCNIKGDNNTASNITVGIEEGNQDHCQGGKCEPNGICIDQGPRYTCICNGGYTGDNCDAAIAGTTEPVPATALPITTVPPNVDECASNPCVAGQCVDKQDSFECLCNQGFTGVLCNQAIDECSSNPCVNGECKPLHNISGTFDVLRGLIVLPVFRLL
jgi:uncharacterized protein YegL